MNEPREWTTGDDCGGQDHIVGSEMVGEGKSVNVIEKSAYDALKAELERANYKDKITDVTLAKVLGELAEAKERDPLLAAYNAMRSENIELKQNAVKERDELKAELARTNADCLAHEVEIAEHWLPTVKKLQLTAENFKATLVKIAEDSLSSTPVWQEWARAALDEVSK